MTEYTCLDCGNKMEYEGGLLWNEALTECFYGFKCPNCGSGFMHRLTREEEEESEKRAQERNVQEAKENKKEIFSPYSFLTPKITIFVLFCIMWFSMIFCIIAQYTQGRGSVWITSIVLSTAGLIFMLVKSRKANKK